MSRDDYQPHTVTIATLPRPLPRTETFVDFRSWVFWVGLGLTVFGAITWAPLVVLALQRNPTNSVLAASLWLMYGFVFLVVLYKMELFERRSPVTVLGALVWGAVATPGIAVVAAPQMHDLVATLMGGDNAWVASIAAPLTEEPLKLLGVVALALIPGARLRSAADGLFYGAVVGLGFQVSESFLYTATIAADGTTATVIAMLILRGVVGGLWNHPTFSATAGAGVGYFFNASATRMQRWGALLGGLALAMVLHGFFDTPLFTGSPLTSSIIKGVPVLILFLVVLRWTHFRERRTFDGLARHVVPDDLVSPADFAALSTRGIRRQARRATRRRYGRRAARTLKYLQGAQLTLLTATHEDGWGSPRTVEYSRDVRILREDFARARLGLPPQPTDGDDAR